MEFLANFRLEIKKILKMHYSTQQKTGGVSVSMWEFADVLFQKIFTIKNNYI